MKADKCDSVAVADWKIFFEIKLEVGLRNIEAQHWPFISIPADFLINIQRNRHFNQWPIFSRSNIYHHLILNCIYEHFVCVSKIRCYISLIARSLNAIFLRSLVIIISPSLLIFLSAFVCFRFGSLVGHLAGVWFVELLNQKKPLSKMLQ